MIEQLKKAAEFLGLVWGGLNPSGTTCVRNGGDYDDFEPELETGAHWLKKMELKLSPEQWAIYEVLMIKEWKKITPMIDLLMWFKTAPTKLCFEKICEVISSEVKNG